MHDGIEAAVQAAEAVFGSRVRELRVEMALSQKAFGEMIGVDASAISRLELGGRTIRLGEAKLIADALGVDLATMLPAQPKDPAADLRFQITEIDRKIIDARRALGAIANAYFEIYRVLNTNPELLRNDDAFEGIDDDLADNAAKYADQLLSDSIDRAGGAPVVGIDAPPEIRSRAANGISHLANTVIDRGRGAKR